MSLTGSASPPTKSGGERGARRLAERAGSLEKPCAGEATEHRERRHHEHEMAQAIVEGRMCNHRHQHRQDGGERDQDIIGAAVERQVASRGRNQRAGSAGQPERQHDFRQLEREQMRQVARRHGGHREQLAGIQFPPRLFEERVEIFCRPHRIERRKDRPGPQQPHDQVTERQCRQQPPDKLPERVPRSGESRQCALRSITMSSKAASA